MGRRATTANILFGCRPYRGQRCMVAGYYYIFIGESNPNWECMINVNELRIGNLVRYFSKPCYVKQIKHENSSYYIAGVDNMGDLTKYYNVADSFEPVPLTPEWLGKRLGFEARQDPDEPLIYSILKMDLDIASMEDGYYLRTNNTDPWCNTNIGRKIEYVHQIQNIYLDLTGEELNVKL